MSATAPKTWRLGDDFDKVMPHHAGIEALWNTKWKFPCTKSVYPFHDGLYSDFEPVFEHLMENSINDPLDPNYTSAFIKSASVLAELAAEESCPIAVKTTILLRACALLRISRFPYMSNHMGLSKIHTTAWTLQKQYYLMAASTFTSPIEEHHIPFPPKMATVPVYLRLPPVSTSEKSPVILLMTGLDGYRPDNTARLDGFLSRGWASVTCEIPGTADCPADPSDPSSADQLWDYVLAWIEEHPQLDQTRVVAWGLSAGGYYAVRIAHTHANRVFGAVAQGAGVHHWFGTEWCAKIEGHEYPFGIFPHLAHKFGYNTREEFLASAQSRFSLLTTGILDMPSTRLLLINGTHDGLMPVEDSLLCLEHGDVAKSAYFVKGRLHMGYPEANEIVWGWLEDVLRRV